MMTLTCVHAFALEQIIATKGRKFSPSQGDNAAEAFSSHCFEVKISEKGARELVRLQGFSKRIY